MSHKVTKMILADELMFATKLSEKIVDKMVDDIIEVVIETTHKEGMVRIRQFGSFYIHKKKARIGRNPKNGKEYTIAAREVMKFRPTEYFKNYINDKSDAKYEIKQNLKNYVEHDGIVVKHP